MGFEDGAVLFPEFLGDGIAVAGDLVAGGGDSAIETLQLVFNRIARDKASRDAKSLVVHDQRLADGHAGRDRDTLKFLHCRGSLGLMAAAFPGAAAAWLARRTPTDCSYFWAGAFSSNLLAKSCTKAAKAASASGPSASSWSCSPSAAPRERSCSTSVPSTR